VSDIDTIRYEYMNASHVIDRTTVRYMDALEARIAELEAEVERLEGMLYSIAEDLAEWVDDTPSAILMDLRASYQPGGES